MTRYCELARRERERRKFPIIKSHTLSASECIISGTCITPPEKLEIYASNIFGRNVTHSRPFAWMLVNCRVLYRLPGMEEAWKVRQAVPLEGETTPTHSSASYANPDDLTGSRPSRYIYMCIRRAR